MQKSKAAEQAVLLVTLAGCMGNHALLSFSSFTSCSVDALVSLLGSNVQDFLTLLMAKKAGLHAQSVASNLVSLSDFSFVTLEGNN
jgi:hypothetical protein